MKRHPQYGLYGDKIIHRAGLSHLLTGQVSARCFKKPRPINMDIASWTIRDEAVTCKKCLALIKHAATKNSG